MHKRAFVLLITVMIMNVFSIALSFAVSKEISNKQFSTYDCVPTVEDAAKIAKIIYEVVRPESNYDGCVCDGFYSQSDEAWHIFYDNIPEDMNSTKSVRSIHIKKSNGKVVFIGYEPYEKFKKT